MMAGDKDLMMNIVVDDGSRRVPILNKSGEEIGKLSDVLNLGASDLYEINTKSGKKLIPAVLEFIKEIDLEKGIFVSLIEGMLD